MVAKKTTTPAVRTRPAALDPSAVVIDGEIEDAPNAFVSSGVADDHPLAIAYQQSYDQGVAKKINTSTPDLVVKLLRKIAVAKDLGIRVQVNGTEVVFRAGEKKKSTRTDLTTLPLALPLPGGEEERTEVALPTAEALLDAPADPDGEYDE